MAKLIYLMGPSGSGKDSLINALRQNPPKGLMVAHRYVTRPWQAGSENHVELTVEEFALRDSTGLLSLSWGANDHFYGIGCEVNAWMDAGHTVLVNGSRAHLDEAKTVYGDALLPVMIHVNEAILRQRLMQRGRESTDMIEARIQRSHELDQRLQINCPVIDNGGAMEVAVAQLRQLIEDSLNTTGKPIIHAAD